MRYAFYFYDNGHYKEKGSTRNFPLDYLFEIITDNQMRFMITVEDYYKDPRKIIVWSNWSKLNLKENLKPKDFLNYDDFLDYLDHYHKQYTHKRLAEMPAIRIFHDNYEFLEQQLQTIYERKPKYLIIREHDNGYVDIVEKDELSEQDIAIMNREHKIFQNYLKRRQAYEKAHPEKLYPIWRGPEDSEFESDFALYDPADEQDVD